MSALLTSTITNLEHETWRAMQSSGAALFPYLSPQCIFLFPMGLKVSAHTTPSLHDVLTSDAFVPWTSYNMEDIEVLAIGNTGAVITYEVSAIRPPLGVGGREEEFRALASTTWTLDEERGKWAMLVHQQTPFNRNMAEDDALGL
jgi:hypothetical protein